MCCQNCRWLIVVYLFSNTVWAQEKQCVQMNDLSKENRHLSQKIKMSTHLLIDSPLRERIISSGNKDSIELLYIAKSNYDLVCIKIRKKNWLEANAIIDSVLRDLARSSQLLNKKKVSLNRYNEMFKKIEAFVLPRWLWLSLKDKRWLKNSADEISNLIEQAQRYANNGEYDKAGDLLNKAYKLKSQLLENLKYDNTIIYDLAFDTPVDEYAYMLNRSVHFLGLIENIQTESSFNLSKQRIIKVHVMRGRVGMDKARMQAKDNQYKQAIKFLEFTIKDLSMALKLMGVTT